MAIIKQWMCIAVAGPNVEIKEFFETLQGAEVKFDKIIKFIIPDDYGEFPDTLGYEHNDFEALIANQEDPALYPYMLKCLDAVEEYTAKKSDQAALKYAGEIERFIEWPKIGASIFPVIGTVKVFSTIDISPN